MYTSPAMKQLWIVMILLPCCGLNSAAQDRVATAIDSLPSVQSIDLVSISPDGAQVAYIVGGELSVASTVNGASRRIAPSQNATRDVTWSADSHYLVWLDDIPGDKPASQLWSASVDGSELTQRASFNGYVQAPRYSPSGKVISVLYIADMPRVAGPLQPMTPLSGVVGSKIYEQRIAAVDLAGNKLKQISPADVYVYEYDWLPDSSGWVGTAAHGSGDNNWWIARLYAIDAYSGNMREIYKPEWQIAEPHVSPDGKSVSFIEGLMSDEGLTGGDVMVVPVSGGSARSLTPGIHASPSSLSWNSNDRISVVANADGNSAHAVLSTAGFKPGAHWNGWTGEEVIGTTTEVWVPSASFSHDGSVSAVIRQSPKSPPEVWAGPAGAWKQVTHLNDHVQPNLGATRNVHWLSDGRQVQGWLTFPKDYDPPAYTVTISGVQDLSGNVMASPVTVTFTTSAGANLVAPSVVSATPTGFSVPINNTVVHVTLAYPINPLTISSATFQLYPSTTHIPVAGTISISADGVTLTFTPSQTLDPSTTYVINLTGGDLDPEGRSLSWSAQFTTVSGSAGLSPVILSLNNTSAAPGTLIAVNGMYFGTSQGTSTITFNGTVPTLYSWSYSQIYAYVPTGATSGPLLVTVNGIASNSIVFNVQQTPTITSISPSSGAAGTVITINGTSFGNSYDPAPQVLGAPFTVTATSWTQTSLQAVIPLSAYPEVQSLTVKQNTRSSSAVNFTVVGTPGISSLSPTSGAPGTPVTINGSNFGSTQGSSTVTFNGVPAASITTWGTSSITAVPPSNVTTGPINVTVNSINSNPTQTFTVTTPAIGNLSPPAAAVGALVNINGSGFYSQGLTTQVYLNGVQVPIAYWGGNPTYPSMGTNQLTVRVPTGATSGNLTVVIGSVTSNAVAFTVEAPPSVTAITPTQGQIGDTVLITGSGFGATQSSSTISFYPGNNAQVVDWSDTAIHVIVPGGTSTGVFNVQVATLTSQGPSFQITNTTQVTDSLGNQSTYATAINAGSWTLSSSSGPGCSSCSVRGNITETVDAKGNVLTHTDDLGHVTTYTYDSNNSVTSVSQQLDANTTVRTSYTYNSFGEALTMTDPLGNVTTKDR